MTGYGVTTTPHPLPLDDTGRALWASYEAANRKAADAYDTRCGWLEFAGLCATCGLMGHGSPCALCRREGVA